MVVSTIILNTASNIFHVQVQGARELDQRDLRHVRGITFAFAELGDTGLAAGATSVARGQFVKELLNNQFIGQSAQDSAASVQLDHHRLVSGLQSFSGLLLVRDNGQEFFAASRQLILQELASLRGQGSLLLLSALLIGANLLIEREAAPASEGQD